MKDITLAMITILKANAAVAAVVGARVYRTIPTDAVKPFIAVARIDKMPETPTSSATYAMGRVQCTAFASTDAAAENLSELIGNAMEGQQDTVISGVPIVEIEDAGAVPDNSDGPTLGTYRDNHDFKITYQLR
jgi:hypothetical protein